MALQQEEKVLTSASDIFPMPKRAIPKKINTVTFKQATAVTLPLLTPVAWTSTGWVVYAYVTGAYAGGTSEDIAGFVYLNEVTTSASGEVLGNVMMEGEIDLNDIPTTSTNMEASLRKAGLRLRNLYINNLSAREG